MMKCNFVSSNRVSAPPTTRQLQLGLWLFYRGLTLATLHKHDKGEKERTYILILCVVFHRLGAAETALRASY